MVNSQKKLTMEIDKEKKTQPIKRINKESAQRLTYKKRMECIKKKSMELSTLCDIKLCMVCLGPNGDFQSWPEKPNDVKEVLNLYKVSKRKKDLGKKVLLHSDQEIKTEIVERKEIHGFSNRVNGLSKDSLKSLMAQIDSKLEIVKARLGFLKEKDDGEKVILLSDQETKIERVQKEKICGFSNWVNGFSKDSQESFLNQFDSNLKGVNEQNMNTENNGFMMVFNEEIGQTKQSPNWCDVYQSFSSPPFGCGEILEETKFSFVNNLYGIDNPMLFPSTDDQMFFQPQPIQTFAPQFVDGGFGFRNFYEEFEFNPSHVWF